MNRVSGDIVFVENPAIRTSFDMLFDYLWELSKADHERILATMQKKCE